VYLSIIYGLKIIIEVGYYSADATFYGIHVVDSLVYIAGRESFFVVKHLGAIVGVKEREVERNCPGIRVQDGRRIVISYTLNKVSDVRIGIYNVLGERVFLFDKDKEIPGLHNIEYTPSAGIYFLKILIGNREYTEKAVVIK